MNEETLEVTTQASKHDGASKAARARAAKLTPERRSEIAQTAAVARWNPVPDSDSIPKAEYPGVLLIGDLELPCAVLSTSMRVLSERGVTKALGGKRGGSHWKRQHEHDQYRPVFLSANNLAPFIPASLSLALSSPIHYKSKSGGIGYGVPATLLPEICEVFLRARRAVPRVLTEQQEEFAKKAEVLVSGLAQVGIIALVDAATGYEQVRERTELNRILEAYIAKELLPWTKRFPNEFYKELFRLRDWQWDPMSVKRPKRVGSDTVDIVYDRLPAKVLEEIRHKNPVVRDGGLRRYHHHRFLTEDIGNPHLEKQIAIATALMRASTSWEGFKRLLDRAVPKENASLPEPQQASLFGTEDDEDEA